MRPTSAVSAHKLNPMDAGMSADVILPGEIQIFEVSAVEEDEESQQTILTTVNEVDWVDVDIPLTIGPAVKIQTKLNVEVAAAEVEHDEAVGEPQEECESMGSEKLGEAEYVFITIDDKVESDEGQTSEPCLLYPDGTVKSLDMDNVVLLAHDDEDVPSRKKRQVVVCKYDGCGRSYSSQHHLKVHERNHTGERPYKCPYSDCNKEFSRDFSLKSHVRTHTGERPYSCPYFCGKAFKTSGDLQKHTRTHTGERPFLCPIEGCDKSFATSNTCRIHMRKHTGERPYVCQVEGCKKEFSSSTNFKNHTRVHSGEKPYTCSFDGCGRAFTEYSSLYKHRNVHEQEKRYKCAYCDKAYRQMTSLTTHKRAIHGIVTSEDGSEVMLEQAIETGEEEVEDNLRNDASDVEDTLRNDASDLTSDSPIPLKTMDFDDEDYGAVYEIV